MNKQILIKICLILTIFCISFSQAFCLSEPEFIPELKEILMNSKIEKLPDAINGKPVNQQEGYSQITITIDKAHKLRGKILGAFLLYENMKSKYEDISKAKIKDSLFDANSVFPKGFSQATAVGIINASQYPFYSGETESAKNTINELLNALKISNVETVITSQKKVNTQRALPFYEKTAIELQKILKKQSIEFINTMQEAEKINQQLAFSNVSAEIAIMNAEGVEQKKFKKQEVIAIGIRYNTESLKNGANGTWEIKAPNANQKTGEFTLEPNKKDEFIKFFEWTIPKEAPNGSYYISVSLSHKNSASKVLSGVFSVDGAPFVITSAFVLNENKNYQTEFKPKDSVLLVIKYEPFDTSASQAVFEWRVFDSTGSLIQNLSTKKTLQLITSDKKEQTKYIKAIIPQDAPAGKCVFQGVINSGAYKEASKNIEFYIKK